MKQQDSKKTPYFAKFLETQKVTRQEREAYNVWPPVTAPWADLLETHKYPSDNDEGIPS